MADTRIRALIFRAEEKTERWSGKSHEELRLSLVSVTCAPDGTDLKNPSEYVSPEQRMTKRHVLDDECLQDFTVRAWCSTETPNMAPFGWGYSYHDVYEVKLERACRMTKTLRHVERYLERRWTSDGQPKSFGAYVARVAQAVGSTAILFSRSGSGNGLYSSQSYLCLNLGHGAERIDAEIAAWQERMRGVVPAQGR